MTLRATTCLLFCAALLPSCDDGVDPGPAPEFRETTSCLKTGTTTTTIAVKTGVPDPDDPHGDRAVELAAEQADEFIVAFARMGEGNDKLCEETCDRDKLGWTGDFCVGGRDYKTGEYEEYKNAEGSPRYRVPVDTGNTDVGCVCE